MSNKCKILIVSLSLFLPVLFGACVFESAIFCTDSIEPALVIQVRDASSKASIADGATGYVRDGEYVDTLQVYGFGSDGTLYSFRAADERPGIYEVVVQRSGFKAWHKTHVAVSTGRCHVKTVRIVADLDSL